MKIYFKFFLLIYCLTLMGCRSLRIPTIYDAQKYGYLEMMVAGQSSDWRYVQEKMPAEEKWMPAKYLEKYGNIDKMLEKSNTTSFVVIKNGQVYYEKYFNGIEQGDLTQIFSITKTFTTAALGLALQDGYIQSLDQPVSDFIPAFKEEGLNRITLYHLAQMQSGLNYDEYKRVVQTLKFYHQRNVIPVLEQPKLSAEPGTVFKYKSIDTQLLGVCIETAIGQSFMDYINEKLFSKLGFQDEVKWSVDSEESKNIKFYGGLNVSARDLAKFGVLIANDGFWNGERILSPMTLSFCKDQNCRNQNDNYCNGWWYDQWEENRDVFFGAGFKGQIMMINKTDNVVIVRLGENKGGIKWYAMLKELSSQLENVHPEPQLHDLVSN